MAGTQSLRSPAVAPSAGVASGIGALWRVLRIIMGYPTGAIGLVLILLFALMAIFGPMLAPQSPFEVSRTAAGGVVRLSPPSWDNWLGTTNQGLDVFSQLLWGARVALTVGVISAIGSIVLGTLIGLIAGYFGGWTDEVLMRITDVAFGIPFLPTALVIISITGPSLALIILLITLFLWRTTARVIRAQVLTLKTRPFVWAAKAAGASEAKIIFVHIAPNVLPLSFLYMAIGVQGGVMLEAALSFLGFGDPHVMSWGSMLNEAFKAGAMRTAWWWVAPPGIALSLFVVSVFMVTRAYEELLNPRLREI
ncbi:ABC transporter permease [Roseomonas terrae]|uniref:ABC transporter permease n=1 Tax=Neoroseomonas terrae TaxID=424799 RepID=A0ABS5ECA7_9PROT|nr:ABC transporter permease [Neoroseomonas terrae]MBR0648644.1 ABC transporter permease [Neoroseomonas terrae]